MDFWRVLQLDGAWDAISSSLTEGQHNKAVSYIDLLEEYGTRLRYPHSLKVKGHDNLFELRPQDVRLFYCFLTGGYAVIVLGTIKREKKLSPEVYAKAAKLVEGIRKLGSISWKRLSQLN